MSAEYLIAELVREAREDLGTARRLHESGDGRFVHLCVESAEKLVRAVAIAEGVTGAATRPRGAWVDLIHDASPIKPMLLAVLHLAASAPQRRDGDDVVRRIAAVLEEVALRFEVDLEARNTPARRAGPIR